MNTIKSAPGMGTKEKISTLWIVVMFNMAFADILSFITPGALQEIMTGYAGKLDHPGDYAGIRGIAKNPYRNDTSCPETLKYQQTVWQT